MSLAEKASLAVAIFAAIASWLMWSGFQPVLHQRRWAMPVALLALAVAIGAALGVATFEPRHEPATTTKPPGGMVSDTGTTTPPTTTNPQIFPAPGEPDTGTTSTTKTATAAPITVTPGNASSAPPVPTAGNERERNAAAIERQRRQALAFTAAADWPKAAEAWSEFVERYAGHDHAADHAAYYNLGVAYEALHDWHDAANAFQLARVVDDHKRDTKNLLRLGRCYAKLGNWNESVAAYEDVLKIDPSNSIAKRCLFWALKQQPTGD